MNQWLSLVGSFGVLIGLVFLVFQIQQANRIATATTEIEIRSLFSEINEALYAVPEVVELLVKCQEEDADLTAQETVRARGFVLRLTNAWQAIEVGYTSDVLPATTFSAVEDDVRAVLTSYPGLAPFLRANVARYPGQGSRRVYKTIEKVLGEKGY